MANKYPKYRTNMSESLCNQIADKKNRSFPFDK